MSCSFFFLSISSRAECSQACLQSWQRLRQQLQEQHKPAPKELLLQRRRGATHRPWEPAAPAWALPLLHSFFLPLCPPLLHTTLPPLSQRPQQAARATAHPAREPGQHQILTCFACLNGKNIVIFEDRIQVFSHCPVFTALCLPRAKQQTFCPHGSIFPGHDVP